MPSLTRRSWSVIVRRSLAGAGPMQPSMWQRQPQSNQAGKCINQHVDGKLQRGFNLQSTSCRYVLCDGYLQIDLGLPADTLIIDLMYGTRVILGYLIMGSLISDFMPRQYDRCMLHNDAPTCVRQRVIPIHTMVSQLIYGAIVYYKYSCAASLTSTTRACHLYYMLHGAAPRSSLGLQCPAPNPPAYARSSDAAQALPPRPPQPILNHSGRQ